MSIFDLPQFLSLTEMTNESHGADFEQKNLPPMSEDAPTFIPTFIPTFVPTYFPAVKDPTINAKIVINCDKL